jgi:hypothetical protein
MAGGLLLVLLSLRAVLGPRPRMFVVRLVVVTAMLGASLGTTLVLIPGIDAIREGTTGPVASLPDDDTRKAEFGRLHGLSNGLMVLALVGGLWLMWVEMKDTH